MPDTKQPVNTFLNPKKMRVEQRSATASSTLRIIVVALLVALQIWWLIYVIMRYEKVYPWITTAISLAAVIISFCSDGKSKGRR